MTMTSSPTTFNPGEEPDALARRAASDRANALCDEIDRRRHDLIGLAFELDGAIAVCRVLLDGGEPGDLEALTRAERIRDQMPV